MQKMKHFIDPTVDYVFKKILGSRGNEMLLLHFINSILASDNPIQKVHLTNPFTEKDKLDDKLAILDIRAEDKAGTAFQIEIQVTTPTFLPHRILHNWSNVYHQQIKAGESYAKLRPVISIWLLTNELFPQTEDFHLKFTAWESNSRLSLSDHMQIHILELKKWHKPERLQIEDIWLYFFKEGKRFKSLSVELTGFEQMRQAMSILQDISERDEDYYRYQSRQEFLRVQLSEQEEREMLEKENAKARTELEQTQNELASKKTELASKKTELESKDSELKSKEEQLELMAKMLRNAGIEPPK